MKQFFFILVASFAFLNSSGQLLPGYDREVTSNGTLSIQPVYHGALVLYWNKNTIYVDPYGGPKGYEGLTAPDFVLITDIHPDHMDTATLNAVLTGNTTLVVPEAVAQKLPVNIRKKKIVTLANGQTFKEADLTITAIPMYNLPVTPEARHPKGRGNGYVLHFADKNIYISGDTEDIPEMRHLKAIDIAFICMNLPFTMGIDQAASAVLEFRPRIVYPYHYRGEDGLSDIQSFKKMVQQSNPAIDVRLRNWYPEN